MPVAFDFRLQPGALSINSDINQMIWLQELEYTLQWSDKRLFESSCAGVIAPRSASQPSMVSISKLASRSDSTGELRWVNSQLLMKNPCRIVTPSQLDEICPFHRAFDFQILNFARI